MAGSREAHPHRAMLDTSVYLSATDEGRAEHHQALAVLDRWPNHGTTLYFSGQILREYLAVATRPADRNGLGLNRADALANVRMLRARTSLLAEDDRVADRLLDLLADIPCGGKQVHDANVAATMLVHGIDTLITINVADFSRYEHLIRVLPLADVS